MMLDITSSEALGPISMRTSPREMDMGDKVVGGALYKSGELYEGADEGMSKGWLLVCGVGIRG